MSSADNLKLYQEFDAAWNAHDVKRVMALFTSDSVFTIYGMATFRGLEEIERFNTNLFDSRPDFSNTVVDIMADDSRVYADAIFSATYAKAITRPNGMVIPVTGRTYKVNSITRMQIRDGKIAEVYIAMNDLDRMRQIGAM